MILEGIEEMHPRRNENWIGLIVFILKLGPHFDKTSNIDYKVLAYKPYIFLFYHDVEIKYYS